MSGLYVIYDLDTVDIYPLAFFHDLDGAIEAAENEMLKRYGGRRHQDDCINAPVFEVDEIPYDIILIDEDPDHARCRWDSLHGKY